MNLVNVERPAWGLASLWSNGDAVSPLAPCKNARQHTHRQAPPLDSLAHPSGAALNRLTHGWLTRFAIRLGALKPVYHGRRDLRPWTL
jgi:hypothetical protein